jgi:hypothetical protein
MKKTIVKTTCNLCNLPMPDSSSNTFSLWAGDDKQEGDARWRIVITVIDMRNEQDIDLHLGCMNRILARAREDRWQHNSYLRSEKRPKKLNAAVSRLRRAINFDQLKDKKEQSK